VKTQQALLACGSTTHEAAPCEMVNVAIPHDMAGACLPVKAGSRIDSIDRADFRRLASTQGSGPVSAVRRIAADQALRFEPLEVEGHLKAPWGVINDEMRRMFCCTARQNIGDKGYRAPIPTQGAVLSLPPNHLLRDPCKRPIANMS
jgi:hypothetical protein